MSYRTSLIFGRPGSGKGMQGRTQGTVPCFSHCACGDFFRPIDTRTSLGKAFLGQLVPDEITVELWRMQILHFVDAQQFKPDLDYLLLDGIPRSIRQAELMELCRFPEDLSPELSGSRQACQTTEEAGDQGQSS